jgi:hypothetical protein
LDILDATGVKEKGTAQAGRPVFVLKRYVGEKYLVS